MTEANENLSIQDFLASLQIPFNENGHEENKGIDECFSDAFGTSQNPVVNSGNQNADNYNLEDLDEYFSDGIGILDSSDVSTDDESCNGESEGEKSECSSDNLGSSDISDENSDILDVPSEDHENALKDFPNDLKFLKSCLSANRKLKEKLTEVLEKIRNSLDENETLMKKFQEAKADEIARRECREPLLATRALFLSPYFAEPGPIGICPPQNEDTIAKLRNNDITAYYHPPNPWSSYEKSKLLKSVYEVSLDYALKPYTQRLDFLKDKIKEQRKNGCLIKYQEIEMKEEIARIKYNIKEKCKKSTKEIIKEAGENIDWMRISAQFFDGRRSEEDCEFMWNNCLNIFVNKKPFSTAEDKKLKEIAKKHHERNWDLIAEELQTGRTAIQCCIRYQSTLNRNMIKTGPFTPEEDKKLRRVVEELRIGDFIPWIQVQQYIGGRTSEQISQHYRVTLKETLNKSPFTKEEDALILACVKKIGSSNYWYKIQKYLPDRDIGRIKHRYFWALNPASKIGPWSDEENFKLIELVKKYGFGKWNVIAKQMPGRPRMVCKRHINTLLIKDEETNEVRFKSPEEVRELTNTGKFTIYYEERRKNIINSAYETLKSALEKIQYHLKTPITLDNLSEISFPGLRLLQKVLLRQKNKSIKWDLNTSGWTKILMERPDLGDDKNTSNSESDFEVNPESNKIESNWMDPEIKTQNLYLDHKERKEMDEDEETWIQKVLLSKLEEEANREPVPYNVKSMISRLGLGATLEYSLCEEYLQQQMGCKTSNQKDDDILCTMNGHNYRISLPKVLHHFVHTRVSEDQILILPPNCTTMDAMNRILESDSMLRKTADFVDHSIVYLRYLLGLTGKQPKCVRCTLEKKNKTNHESYQVALDNMKSHLLIPTVELKKSAMVETLFPAYQLKECWCDELIESKKTVELLTKRFMTLFFWPYFLQSIEPTKQQTELLTRSGSYKYKQKKRKKKLLSRDKNESENEGCSKRKRRRKNLTDTETEEEDSESDRLSCSSSSTTVQRSQSHPHTAQNKADEVEVVCLSDTPEDFPYAEPME
ncbi:uncharacterized protein LOC129989356 isoform X1 [Argiope bruennichi]|uniref:uncharacterized protein LOC129989356 isoform X1 n=1 Tax=Argiope bruennichi TaxID=94029 RepID=UPI00249428A3|nr:uncharacterized protein LOC129989356 isoform X1 [Argiope bruennichi]